MVDSQLGHGPIHTPCFQTDNEVRQSLFLSYFMPGLTPKATHTKKSKMFSYEIKLKKKNLKSEPGSKPLGLSKVLALPYLKILLVIIIMTLPHLSLWLVYVRREVERDRSEKEKERRQRDRWGIQSLKSERVLRVLLLLLRYYECDYWMSRGDGSRNGPGGGGRKLRECTWSTGAKKERN